MSHSVDDRKTDVHEALAHLLNLLNGHALNEAYFDPASEPLLKDVKRTTWDELLKRGLVKHIGSPHPPIFALTGRGWLVAHEVANRLAELRNDATKLLASLKRTVKGRIEDAAATIWDFQSDGLTPAFVFNAVECALLEELFPGRGYSTRWLDRDPWNSGAPAFWIPRDFGLQDVGTL